MTSDLRFLAFSPWKPLKSEVFDPPTLVFAEFLETGCFREKCSRRCFHFGKREPRNTRNTRTETFSFACFAICSFCAREPGQDVLPKSSASFSERDSASRSSARDAGLPKKSTPSFACPRIAFPFHGPEWGRLVPSFRRRDVASPVQRSAGLRSASLPRRLQVVEQLALRVVVVSQRETNYQSRSKVQLRSVHPLFQFLSAQPVANVIPRNSEQSRRGGNILSTLFKCMTNNPVDRFFQRKTLFRKCKLFVEPVRFVQ